MALTKKGKNIEKKEAKINVSKKRNILTYRIILAPLVTEKTNVLALEDKFVFKVSLNATKNEIKKAIENKYDVHVENVRVVRLSGKKVRQGKVSGVKKDIKKAIVKVKKGEKIDIYEGV